ncbi:NB-ARC domain-containing protein [Nonomuraea sp. PA05]|uniref:NB-ARC domain-containing protein n=1 Tax=Nonomuraea sp. PA05 TaxID=2604466 RepID=UPI0016521A29|nr:NB-ARC domain-containing protein [Nonomuraea sp. PA05]
MLSPVLSIGVGALTNLATSNPTVSLIVALLVLGLGYTGVEFLRNRSEAAGSGKKIFQVPLRTDWVERPAEIREVLRALRLSDKNSPVALTAGVHGAGGFGKSVLANAVCYDSEVRKRFDAVKWVTVGRDRTGPKLIELINEVAAAFGASRSSFSDPEQAGQHLGQVLDDAGRVLLVIDDVWTADQLVPFLQGAPRCTRLITTRNPKVLPRGAVPVRVDQMGPEVSRELLLRGDLRLSQGQIAELLDLTGEWPLLLAIVNSALLRRVRRGARATDAAADIIERMSVGGPTSLDVRDAAARDTAVRISIEHGLETLDGTDRVRFLELGVFEEDAEVPIALVAALWRMSGEEAESLCEKLDGLSLLSSYSAGAVSIHDVVRGYIRHTLGHAAIAATNERFVEAVRTGSSGWWELPEENTYLWRHLAHHLAGAGLTAELDELVCDARWVAAKLVRFGPSAVEADLAWSAAPLAGELAGIIAQSAHVFAEVEERATVLASLAHRLHASPDLAKKVLDLLREEGEPRLESLLPPPDLPDPALIRTLHGHLGLVKGVAFAPGGQWLVSAGFDGIRFWDADGGLVKEVDAAAGATGLAMAPDGTWMVTSHTGGEVRLWNADGTLRREITAHRRPWPWGGGWINVIAMAPDGSWFATGSQSGAVALWNGDGDHLRTLQVFGRRVSRRAHHVERIVISADSTRMTVIGRREARTWRVADGRPVGDPSPDEAVYTAAGGPWGAVGLTAGWRLAWQAGGVARTADVEGRPHGVLVSPDGRWLAALIGQGIELWESDGTRRAGLRGHSAHVTGLALSPDGRLLASSGNDRTVRIWSVERALARPDAEEGHRVRDAGAVVVSRDGSRVAALTPVAVHLMDADGGRREHIDLLEAEPYEGLRALFGDAAAADLPALDRHVAWVLCANYGPTRAGLSLLTSKSPLKFRLFDEETTTLAMAPDDTWFATLDAEGFVRVRGSDGRVRHRFKSRQRPRYTDIEGCDCLTIAPRGDRLATTENGRVHLWRPDGARLATLRTRSSHLQDVVISPDLSVVAAFGSGSMAKRTLWGLVWARRDVNVIRVWYDGKIVGDLRGHRAGTSSIALSPSGRLLASTGDEGVLLVSEVLTLDPVAAIRVDDRLSDCAWLPDGSGLFAVGAAGVYRFALRDHDGSRGP